MSDFFSFEATVNFGQLLQVGTQVLEVASILGGGAMVLWKLARWTRGLDVAIEAIDVRLDKVDAELSKQTTILVSLGEQGVRIANLESQMGAVNQRLNP